MSYFLFLIFITIIIFIFQDVIFNYLGFNTYNDNGTKTKSLPYKRKDFLLNIPERKFFEYLNTFIPENYIIFPQMVLSNIVKVETNKENFWTYQNKINRKTIDFVIFEKKYLKPIIAIEYDGKTHDKQNRIDRDIFIDSVLSVSGIKIIHIKHGKLNNKELINLKETILNILG